HAGRPQVLLRPGVDEGEARDVRRPPEEVRGHVRDQRDRAHVRPGMPLRAEDGVVAGDVDIGRLRVQLELGLARDAGVVLVRYDVGAWHTAGSEELRLLESV